MSSPALIREARRINAEKRQLYLAAVLKIRRHFPHPQRIIIWRMEQRLRANDEKDCTIPESLWYR